MMGKSDSVRPCSLTCNSYRFHSGGTHTSTSQGGRERTTQCTIIVLQLYRFKPFACIHASILVVAAKGPGL